MEGILGDQVPMQSLKAAHDYLAGVGNKAVNAAQVVGPMFGMTFSKGAPGGPAVGVMYNAKDEHQFKVNEALPAIREQIQGRKFADARKAMHALGMSGGYQNWVIHTTLHPQSRISAQAMREFKEYATPDEREAMANAQTELRINRTVY